MSNATSYHPTEQHQREVALNHALDLHRGESVESTSVIETADAFLRFLKGER